MSVGRGRLAFLLPNMRGGGAERVVLELIKGFLAQGRQVDLLLMAAEGELMPLVPSEVRVIDFGAPKIRHVLRPLVRYLRRERPEGLQVLLWPLTVIGILAHRLARSDARLVVSDHTTLSRQYGQGGGVIPRALRWTTRVFYPLSDARIAVSRAAALDLADLSGMKPEAIEVIYNPVAAPAPLPVGTPEPDWGDAGSRVLAVGSLNTVKNHALLIDAFARFGRSRSARLIILGEGPLRPALERQLAALGLCDSVRLPGFVLSPAVHLATAQLFVLSSDYEGYPLVLVEAMQAGLNVVSTDCESGPREILDGGSYGQLVPCGDAAALATAMEAAILRPIDAATLQRRAAELGGAEAVDRYLALMTQR